ncbi:hypothetical protein [Lentzea tibetensis]|uniref:hypothetical protein n=1 Tax=Lentzea tibetensis TaxID=2591470 RepID=UPI00164621AF|nr:hypothetical protein [Lentzea tibetensis]
MDVTAPVIVGNSGAGNMMAALSDRLGVEPVEIDGGHCPQIRRAEVIAEVVTDLVTRV